MTSHGLIVVLMLGIVPAAGAQWFAPEGELQNEIMHGNIEKLEVILDNNPDLVSQKDSREITPFVFTYLCRRYPNAPTMKIMKLLADRGADVDAPTLGGATVFRESALHSGLDEIELAKFLITLGADVNAEDSDGFTALDICSRGAESLESLGALGSLIRDNGGRTTLRGDFRAAIVTGNIDSATKLIEQHPELADTVYASRQTPLHDAVTAGHTRIVELLLNNDFEINAQDYRGMTPLFFAVLAARDANLVRFLIDHGADPEVRDERGRTVLHWAGDRAVAKVLMTLGCDLDSKDRAGNTVLHSIIAYQLRSKRVNTELLEFLLSKGASLEETNDRGEAPLDIVRGQESAEAKKIVSFFADNR
ncbi:MAG: ankyrin repeat domain-containing protein [Lentisphaeria bacterium]|jgi:ankyrin repeat protein|nr:ankyrin repeat domain-containing protein [Lentisphaeria bacterium]